MTQEVKKLWQVDAPLHPLVQQYTAGDDVIYDQQLVPYDIAGTKAHAKMLAQGKVISAEEYKSLIAALDKLLVSWENGDFIITAEQEDCHTAIEQYLTAELGEVGKKIHTGRSRNDQAITMVRLYLVDKLNQVEQKLKLTVNAFESKAEVFDYPMPGYTHMQKAMPTKTSTWLNSYADALHDSSIGLQAVGKLIDRNPLGSASGFGIANFTNDRELTARELGFGKVQTNPQYVGMSRGLFEYSFVQSLSYVMLITNKFATDMMLFTTQEFNYFSLPDEYTTGSSIMPQKRNYDLFEIMRSNLSTVIAAQQAIALNYADLMSGYNRDLQAVKSALISSVDIVVSTLDLLCEVVPKLSANKTKLSAAMTDDLFVTEQVYELVANGMPFRDAYLKVKKSLSD